MVYKEIGSVGLRKWKSRTTFDELNLHIFCKMGIFNIRICHAKSQ